VVQTTTGGLVSSSLGEDFSRENVGLDIGNQPFLLPRETMNNEKRIFRNTIKNLFTRDFVLGFLAFLAFLTAMSAIFPTFPIFLKRLGSNERKLHIAKILS
jgi:hypothetical protein